jgi:large subunit ribosomal protein L6
MYIYNHVKGVSEGHTAILRLVGVGYRASVERREKEHQEYPDQHSVVLKLGFAHGVEEPVPEGIKVTIASPTRVLMEGIDKEALMSYAAQIRKWRPPEPYKGKGIFVNDQTIKLKGKKGK